MAPGMEGMADKARGRALGRVAADKAGTVGMADKVDRADRAPDPDREAWGGKQFYSHSDRHSLRSYIRNRCHNHNRNYYHSRSRGNCNCRYKE
jgi:hypothetical protein